MSDFDGDDASAGAHQSGGSAGSWFPEPTALQPLPGSGDGPGGPERRRRTSGTKILTYALLFVCLVGVSLYLRSSHDPKSTKVGTSGGSSPTTGVVQPHLDAQWLGSACVSAEPGGKGFIVSAGYTSTAGVVTAWEDSLSGGQVTSSAATLAPDASVGVCYIDGPWKVPPEVQQQYASAGLSPDRGVVIVLEDEPQGQTEVGQPFIVSHKQLDLVRPYVTQVTATATAPP